MPRPLASKYTMETVRMRRLRAYKQAWDLTGTYGRTGRRLNWPDRDDDER